MNRRATYAVKLAPQGLFKGFAVIHDDDRQLIDGVDSTHVVVIGVTRMPFSSGKLGITLGADQVPRKVEITSQTGAAKALEVEKSRLEYRQKVEEAKAKARAGASATGATDDTD